MHRLYRYHDLLILLITDENELIVLIGCDPTPRHVEGSHDGPEVRETAAIQIKLAACVALRLQKRIMDGLKDKLMDDDIKKLEMHVTESPR